MKLSYFFPLALCLHSGAALAQLELNCLSDKASDQVQVGLSFQRDGTSGSIQADYWGGAYPFGLVWANLGPAQPAGDRLEFQSDEDKHNGAIARLDLPADFQEAKGPVSAQLEIRDPGPKGKIFTYSLHCKRR